MGLLGEQRENVSYDLTYISFGAGVQSSALLVCSNLGLHGVPRADVAVFADTGDEPQYVYDYLEIMREWSEIPVETCSNGHLSKDLVETDRTFAAVPAWRPMANGREMPMRRQCTREYKITPIEKHVRALLGYEPRQRINESVRCLLGISLDEASRVKPSRTRWVTNEWPLIDARLRRHDCVRIVEEAGLPTPSKSSCHFCPYHSDRYFSWLKEEHPEDFDLACSFDEAMRAKHPDDPLYIHRSMKPLRDVDFTSNQLELFEEECEGYCGI